MDRVVDELVSMTGELRYETMSEQVRHVAKRMVLDALGCALGGYNSDVSRIARHIAQVHKCEAGCQLIGGTTGVPAELAAFANGVMVRYLDFNDAYGSAGGVGHPSDYVSAVIAAAEESGAGPEALLQGVVVAYETFCRLTDATGLGVERFDHVVNGAIAAALGTASVWGLSPQQACHAASLALVPNLAIQASRLGTLSMWKGCAAGNAARNGIFAARLASLGLTGPEAPFQGRGGLTAVTDVEIDLDALRRDGSPLAILDCNVKRFPSGYFSQGAVEAALEVRNKVASPDDIVAVEIGTFAFGKNVMAGDEEKWHPTTRETADHSMPYVVATALVKGRLDQEDFSSEALADPAVARLLSRLTVERDEECEREWPGACMNKVCARLADGSAVSATVRHYRGHSQNPMSDQELADKFMVQAVPILGAEGAAGLAEAVLRLEETPSATSLLALTRAAA